MNEDEPFLILGTPNGDRRMDRYNSALFTFLGHTATGEDLSSRSHVFVASEEDGQQMGMFIFAATPKFDELEDYMVENDYPMHLNMRQVPDCDEDAYQQMINNEIASNESATLVGLF